jgi:hypothetical protein
MCQHLRSFSLAASIALFGGDSSLAAPICKPDLSFKNVQLSELKDMQRKWTAVLDVDASRCATDFGRFDINFVRERENAPELSFAEQFTWQTDQLRIGQIEVSLDFWMDEAVLHYSVGYVSACGCRSDSVRLQNQK